MAGCVRRRTSVLRLQSSNPGRTYKTLYLLKLVSFFLITEHFNKAPLTKYACRALMFTTCRFRGGGVIARRCWAYRAPHSVTRITNK